MVTYATPDMLQTLSLDQGIGTFSQYRSLLSNIDSLSKLAADPQNNVTLCLHQGDTVVGYCVRRRPPEDERWHHMNPPVLYEVFGENARGWRDQKLMKPMLKTVCSEPANDDNILYIVGYSWTWDLDDTKKTLTEYRDTIIHLLAPLGFKQFPTNEPNVSLRAENLFMARIGDNIAKDTKRRFTNLLFGIYDE
jgi:acetoin utilization protein AcuA